MEIKSIKGTSSNVKIKFDNYTAIFSGELLSDGFLVYQDTLEVFDNEEIKVQMPENVVDILIKKSIAEGKKNNFVLIFE